MAMTAPAIGPAAPMSIRAFRCGTGDLILMKAPKVPMNDGKLPAFKALCERFVAKTQGEEKVLYYGFSFDGDQVHCREGYRDADGLLVHLESVGALLQEALGRDRSWTQPVGCPTSLPLFLLAEGDFREAAAVVSCHQAIAADGAFSLGMLADLADSVRATGAWWYRRLFWEAGLLGQVLYLEAEAAGVRGTGIGCYFDDAFHQVLGLRGERFQSLYHFTVGGPVDDPRLTTLPGYFHVVRAP